MGCGGAGGSRTRTILSLVGLADDQLNGTLALAVVGGGDEDLGEVVAGAPGGAVDGLDLEEVGAGADVAEGGDVVAEGGLLAGDFEVLHQGEVIFGELGDRPAAAADEDEDVGGMRVAIGGGTCGGLGGNGQCGGATHAGLHDGLGEGCGGGWCGWFRSRCFKDRLKDGSWLRFFDRGGRRWFGDRLGFHGLRLRLLFGRGGFLHRERLLFYYGWLFGCCRLFSRSLFRSRFFGHRSAWVGIVAISARLAILPPFCRDSSWDGGVNIKMSKKVKGDLMGVLFSRCGRICR